MVLPSTQPVNQHGEYFGGVSHGLPEKKREGWVRDIAPLRGDARESGQSAAIPRPSAPAVASAATNRIAPEKITAASTPIHTASTNRKKSGNVAADGRNENSPQAEHLSGRRSVERNTETKGSVLALEWGQRFIVLIND